MSDDKMRIKIAEACGWTHIQKNRLYNLQGVHPIGGDPLVPDYLNDLNAIHKAEKVLTQKQRRKYCQRLWQINGNGGQTVHWRLVNSTARQRAEAFIRAIA